MKIVTNIILTTLTLLMLSACQGNSESKPYVIGDGVNPNSVAFKAEDNALERKNKIKMAEIQANSKIEIAKIESIKAVEVAKINSKVKKDIAQQTASTTLEVTKLDKETKEQQSMINLYIAIGFLIALLVGIVLWFRHKHKALEVKANLEENRLRHELEIKNKELQEQRIQKVLELAISGQLPQDVQKEVISSLTQPKTKILEESIG